MKKLVIALLAALLLTGCTASPGDDSTSLPSESAATAEPTQSFYVPSTAMERSTSGAVRTYEMDCAITGLSMLDGNLLVCADGNTLYLLSGETLEVQAQRELDSTIAWNQASLVITQDRVAYFDSELDAYVILDCHLRATSTLPIGDHLDVEPVIAQDFNTIYYIDGSSIRALDLTTGSARLLRQDSGTLVSLDGLYFEDSVLRFSRLLNDGSLQTCFINAQAGTIYYTAEFQGKMVSWDDRFAAVLELEHPLGTTSRLLSGTQDGTVQMLKTNINWDSALFPGNGQVIIQEQNQVGLTLTCYDLTDGAQISQVTMPQLFTTFTQGCSDGDRVWLWDGEGSRFYCWDMEISSRNDHVADPAVFTAYASLSQPDTEAMAVVLRRSQTYSEQYGVQISFVEDGNRSEGLDYSGYLDYRPDFYAAALEALADTLRTLPDGFLAGIGDSAGSGRLQIHLVDDFDPETGIGTGTGSINVTDGQLIIRVSMCQDLPEIFYHELFHIMEVQMRNTGDGLKDWDDLNPSGFSYAESYADYEAGLLEDSMFLNTDKGFFADSYSLVNGREDRAQIFLYAMLDAQSFRFRSQPMQAKLSKLCQLIRSTYGIAADASLPWEQYLQ